MWKYVIHSAVRVFLPPRVPDADLAGLSPRYCYSVWLRHLVTAWHAGVRIQPRVVVELGPGASQGVGLAALLSGSDCYTSVDVVDYHVEEHNIAILDSLISLFQQRADIPGPEEFPCLCPPLPSYKFPTEIFSEPHLRASLAPERLEAIRAACRAPGSECQGVLLRHHTVRSGTPALPDGYADMILSQAVLLYVPDLESVYASMVRLLRPGGFMTHQNDYRISPSFPDTPYWNSHWACSYPLWNILKWRQLFVINRHPHSSHLALMKKYDLDVVYQQAFRRSDGIPRGRLSREFCEISDADLETSAAFLVAVKRSQDSCEQRITRTTIGV
jgi:SAM-dependent methyltransferase